MYKLLTIAAALLLSTTSVAHNKDEVPMQRSECDGLMAKLPLGTTLDRVHQIHGHNTNKVKKFCIVEWNTIQGYASRMYVKKFGCAFNGDWKYFPRHLRGTDKYGQPHIYDLNGPYYHLYYSCPIN